MDHIKLYINSGDHILLLHFSCAAGFLICLLISITFLQVATQLGRYAITMMSSGVVLGVGFQLSGLSYTCIALPLLSASLFISHWSFLKFHLTSLTNFSPSRWRQPNERTDLV